MMETATISLLTLHSPKIIHQAKFLLLAQYTNQPYPQLLESTIKRSFWKLPIFSLQEG
jgi:hypothetical protein